MLPQAVKEKLFCFLDLYPPAVSWHYFRGSFIIQGYGFSEKVALKSQFKIARLCSRWRR